jgi:simple sugar transport system substrate-binding protein
MKFTKFLATTAAATTLLALTACTGTGQQEQQPNNASGEKLDIAVITHAPPGDEFWDLVKSGAERAGSDLNVAVSYQGDSDPVKQSQLIDSAIAQQVDGIVLSMANPDGVRAAMASAKAANIPMAAINAGGDSAVAQGALTFVGQDPVVAAKAAGERLVQAGVTKISCVIQVAGNVYLETTCSELAKIPGLSVTNLQVDGTNIADVQATIKSQLLADPSINGVFTINTDIGKAATEAVAETGSNAKVTAYNLNDDMVELIKSGKVLFTVDQQGFLQGYQATQILHENVKYGNVLGGGQPVFTGPSFVTSENVDDVASFVSQGTR